MVGALSEETSNYCILKVGLVGAVCAIGGDFCEGVDYLSSNLLISLSLLLVHHIITHQPSYLKIRQ